MCLLLLLIYLTSQRQYNYIRQGRTAGRRAVVFVYWAAIQLSETVVTYPKRKDRQIQRALKRLLLTGGDYPSYTMKFMNTGKLSSQ
jgi:hypothetical protein